ncbi:hypothetical protein IE53DRAFT_385567 [Violaceomyces palustris]|uniref:Uncharacterized protein n=1 Tax=Violaceomyces palustris TaxID=1673888 RepID=A0ACD0P1Z6_9BASI|nr:hypothetical protein IE53DRAFT_385567 [Violaceomyces palustris]
MLTFNYHPDQGERVVTVLILFFFVFFSPSFLSPFLLLYRLFPSPPGLFFLSEEDVKGSNKIEPYSGYTHLG